MDAILENVGCGIYVWAPKENKILYANQSFHEFFPTEEKEEELMRILKGGCAYTEYYVPDSNRWFDVRSSKIQWVDGRTVVLYTIYEVTDKKLYQQKVERQANNDFLTGLYNRMRCEHDLQHFIKQTKEIGGQGALLYIDLDDFKHINDGLGHQYGDVLLQAVSHSLQRIPGIESTCYRMGGDEFYHHCHTFTVQYVKKYLRGDPRYLYEAMVFKRQRLLLYNEYGCGLLPDGW